MESYVKTVETWSTLAINSWVILTAAYIVLTGKTETAALVATAVKSVRLAGKFFILGAFAFVVTMMTIDLWLGDPAGDNVKSLIASFIAIAAGTAAWAVWEVLADRIKAAG